MSPRRTSGGVVPVDRYRIDEGLIVVLVFAGRDERRRTVCFADKFGCVHIGNPDLYRPQTSLPQPLPISSHAISGSRFVETTNRADQQEPIGPNRAELFDQRSTQANAATRQVSNQYKCDPLVPSRRTRGKSDPSRDLTYRRSTERGTRYLVLAVASSSAIRAWTRSAMSSRIMRTTSRGWPAGSGSFQLR